MMHCGGCAQASEMLSDMPWTEEMERFVAARVSMMRLVGGARCLSIAIIMPIDQDLHLQLSWNTGSLRLHLLSRPLWAG